jgi:hypothetical protein
MHAPPEGMGWGFTLNAGQHWGEACAAWSVAVAEADDFVGLHC